MKRKCPTCPHAVHDLPCTGIWESSLCKCVTITPGAAQSWVSGQTPVYSPPVSKNGPTPLAISAAALLELERKIEDVKAQIAELESWLAHEKVQERTRQKVEKDAAIAREAAEAAEKQKKAEEAQARGSLASEIDIF